MSDAREGHYPGCQREAGHWGPCEPNAMTAPEPAPARPEVDGLSEAIVAHIWREHSNCTWVSTGVNVMWSCGIWHGGPIHMQPTTRDRHFAALVMTQIEADRSVAERGVAARVEAAKAEAWDEGFEACGEWIANNPTPAGIPIDPPLNPHDVALRADHAPTDAPGRAST